MVHATGQTEAQIGLEYDIIRRQVRSKYLNTNTNKSANTNANTKIKETHQANLDRDQMRGCCKYNLYDIIFCHVGLKYNYLKHVRKDPLGQMIFNQL